VVGRDVQISEDGRNADVRFRVETGDRLLFLFRGMKVLGETELRKFLTEDVLSQTDGPRVVGDRIVDRYRQLGYPFCRVDFDRKPEPAAKRTVVQFTIHEGTKVFLDHLAFPGVDPEKEDELAALFL